MTDEEIGKEVIAALETTWGADMEVRELDDPVNACIRLRFSGPLAPPLNMVVTDEQMRDHGSLLRAVHHQLSEGT